MARLVVMNTKDIDIPGLARHRAFDKLSQKRITKAVRDTLRAKYGTNNVEVSCAAVWKQGMWTGHGWINGEMCLYRVMRGFMHNPATQN